MFRDSRGLVRALIGDTAAAIQDFAQYVEVYGEIDRNNPLVAKRQAWIKSLEAGKNPFSSDVLMELRDE
jgi:hypothetical protein